ncbi:hypothetical protein [Lysobacter sp. 1R34A]|uniref:hypothetical protein n=1 Tax=Lysobacter sp. 1R34A TaxID=3445786 RepID=UPI003EEE2A2B
MDSIDNPDAGSNPVLKRSQPHIFRGWFVDQTTHQGPGSFLLVFRSVDQAFELEANTQVTRADVAAFLKLPGIKTPGYNVQVPLATLPTGRYDVELAFSAADKLYLCKTGRTVTLAD